MSFLLDVGSALALITGRYEPRSGAMHSFSLNDDGALVLMLALPDEFLRIVLGVDALSFSPTDLAVEVGKIVEKRRRLDD